MPDWGGTAVPRLVLLWIFLWPLAGKGGKTRPAVVLRAFRPSCSIAALSQLYSSAISALSQLYLGFIAASSSQLHRCFIAAPSQLYRTIIAALCLRLFLDRHPPSGRERRYEEESDFRNNLTEAR